MGKRTDWEEIRQIGGGGQSNVFLVRSPARVKQRRELADLILRSNPWAPTTVPDTPRDRLNNVVGALSEYTRPDQTVELGALKLFKIPPEAPVSPPPVPGSKEFEAVERLRNEIAALSKGLPGLPKLLDCNLEERWIVTEYFSGGTLEDHLSRYRGKVIPALKAFRSLVQTTASLHKDGIVHRDIKPANVFIGQGDELVLGDFGIAFDPNSPDRITRTKERVGPRDYMPQWANLGARHEGVLPRDDVYMLGKLLWSMVDGRVVLPREYHKRSEYDFDLTRNFPNDPDMYLVNSILDACVVEKPEDCLSGGQDLLLAIETALGIIKKGGQLLEDGVPRPCHVCGQGEYKLDISASRSPVMIRFWATNSDIKSIGIRPFSCTYCGHFQLFKT